MYVLDNLGKYNLKPENPQVTTLDILVSFSIALPVFIKESDHLCLTDCFQGELEKIFIDVLGVGRGFPRSRTFGKCQAEWCQPGLGRTALPGRTPQAPLGGVAGRPWGGGVGAALRWQGPCQHSTGVPRRWHREPPSVICFVELESHAFEPTFPS